MPTAIDPVCQMEVDTDNPPGGKSDHEGTTYYFCAPGCKVAFDREPHGFLDGQGGGPHHDQGGESRESSRRPGFLARLFGRR